MYDAKADFSDSYQESRAKFLEAVGREGEVTSVLHPEKGPDGGDLYMDFGVFGPDDAKGALVLISGTHGPEIFAGSGPQIAFLNGGLIDEYRDLKIVLIHAHNPYGSAWLRRTDHQNIDLNRNYCDFSKRFEPHPGYDELRPIVVPEKWDDQKLAAGLKGYEDEHGKLGLLAAMLLGQVHDPDGLFYKGQGPSWSRQVIEETLPKLIGKQETASVIDFHTGLGPFGVPYIVHGYKPGTAEFNAFRKAYDGEVRSTEDIADRDESLPASPEGPIVLGVHKILANMQSYAVVIEYGTVPPEQVFPALMKDNWVHARSDPSSAIWTEAKAEMRAAFYPDSDEWKDKIWERAVWAIDCSAKLARGHFS